MAIVDLLDENGVLVGRDEMNIETESTILDNQIIRIQDGKGTVEIYSVPVITPVKLPDYEIPPVTEIAEIYGIGVID